MKDWNDAHRAGYSAREHADVAWTKKHKQDEVEAGAVGHDQAADGIGAENDKAWTKPKIGEEQRKPSRIKLVPFEEICLGTERPYLVKGLIPRTGLIVIWGPPKSGKSFWTFDLIMHVALSWDYWGRRVQQGVVVYCAFEGQSGIKKRVEAFRLRHLAEDANRQAETGHHHAGAGGEALGLARSQHSPPLSRMRRNQALSCPFPCTPAEI